LGEVCFEGEDAGFGVGEVYEVEVEDLIGIVSLGSSMAEVDGDTL
jgi:hypothetical protein